MPGLDPNQILEDLYNNLNDPYSQGDQEPPLTNNIPGAEHPAPITDLVNPVTNQPTSNTYTPNITSPTFKPSLERSGLMSLDEMMDVINRRTELATQPRLEALDRQREETMYSTKRRVNEVSDAYNQARNELTRDTNLQQQRGAQTMARRGIYDSGLAAHLGNQIARSGLSMGLKLGQEQARQLADIAEYLDLQTRHNMEEIKSIMGEKGMMAATLLDEMRLEQQARGDMLAQQEFENWLAHQAHQLNEYWRQQEFDAGRADQDWSRWFNEEQVRLQQEQNEWERVFNMNKFEAEHELQRMLANHQISQAEFNNALALDDFNLKKWLYQVQNRQPTTIYTPSTQASTGSMDHSAWWKLF
jgi:hypothetical protein